MEKLKNKKFLNKKYRPSAVTQLLTLKVADIIKYFNQVLLGYLFFFRCVDDFNYVKRRFY